MTGYTVEKPEKSSFTTLGIWTHDLTPSFSTPVRHGLASPQPRELERLTQWP